MNETRRFSCIAAVLASIIIAAVSAAVSIIIPGFALVASVIAMLAVAVLLLIAMTWLIAFAASLNSPTLTRCADINSTCLLIGIIGTIVAGIVALPILLLSVPIVANIVFFFVVLFFSIAIISLIALLRCILSRPCYRG